VKVGDAYEVTDYGDLSAVGNLRDHEALRHAIEYEHGHRHDDEQELRAG
jgi:hypothetical protein